MYLLHIVMFYQIYEFKENNDRSISRLFIHLHLFIHVNAVKKPTLKCLLEDTIIFEL